MPKVYGSITISDIADVGRLSVYLTSNQPQTVIENPNGDAVTYTPDWTKNNLVLTPIIYFNEKQLQLPCTGLTVTWKRQEGSESASEVDFDAKFDKSIVDKFGEEIQNGLAPNINTTTEDPNTTLKQLIVTNKNTPTGQYMYIETRFFDTKSLTANRSQTAYPYSVEGSSYHRFYYGGSWSPWNRITNASELGTKSMTVMFPSGGTDISGANIINCTILSHDSSDGYLKQSGGGIAIGEGVSSVLVSASVFGWCQKIASTGYFWNRISRFRGTAETEICATITPLNASLYASTIFSPILIQVQAGDVLKLKKMNTENIRIRGLGNTYLTVQVAELE